jgi:integrase
MPHYPKPFFREDRGLWYVQLHGKQHNLGSDKDDAFRRYHQLMQAPTPVESTLALGIIDGFLEWTKQHRSAGTYGFYYEHLQSFTNSLLDKRLQTEQLKPFHVQQWVDSHPSWGPTYRRGAIGAVQRAFLWAEKLGHIEKSPICHIEKPKAERRDNPWSPADFKKALTHIKDQPFRDLMEFAWESGCRPQEARLIEAHHVNLQRGRIEIPPDEAKGKKRWRIIYLTEKAAEIVERLLPHRQTGKLFLNVDGNPWKMYAICNRFTRLQKKLGKSYCAYDLRHSFATRQLKNGNDPITVAALLGHVDATMLCKIYEHLSTDDDHLRDRLQKGALSPADDVVPKSKQPMARNAKPRAKAARSASR